MNVIKDERNLFLLLNYTNQVPDPDLRNQETKILFGLNLE